MPSLIVIRMAVAPVPVIPLILVFLSVVGAIILVPFRQVASVGMFFAVIPVMIIPMVSIVDSDMNADLLRFGGRHN